MFSKVLLLLLDSVGVGALPDAAEYGDATAATVPHVLERYPDLQIRELRELGLCQIDGLEAFRDDTEVRGKYCRLASRSRGKDSIVGHWELMGEITDAPFLTFPDGFPEELLQVFCQRTGAPGVLGNCPESGTAIIARLGEEHERTGKPIVYTSADSVFQIACHEEVVPVPQLYEWCEIARDLFDEMGLKLGRVIARPFVGEPGNYTRTANRHDYAAEPKRQTVLDVLKAAGIPVHSIGKPVDIFAGRGFTSSEKTKCNAQTLELAEEAARERNGLIFANVLDFDQLWGHRRDAEGYAKGLEEVSAAIPGILEALGDDGMLIVTADHGCDPTYIGTDHTREYIPALLWHAGIRTENLGTRDCFADVGRTILDAFNVAAPDCLPGKSLFAEPELS